LQKQQCQAAGLTYVELEPDIPASELPLIVGLHGRGADAEDLAGLVNWLSVESCRFALPNGPLPVVNAPWHAGFAWYVLGQHQAASIAACREQLMAFVDELERRYETPRERIVLLGFSQGAVMTLEVGLRSERPFAGLVVMGGYLYAPETLGPFLRAGRDRQIQIVHGAYDDVVSVDGGRLARDVLEAAGLEPEYHELPIGHQVSSESLALVRSFMERVLRRSPHATRSRD
jgi:phospholipase/carboxylesterase